MPRRALQLVAARTGDHAGIFQLLQGVFAGPSAAEFQAQLDEPGYDPATRLVVKDGARVVAHLRVAPQRIQLETTDAPAVRFMDLATAPEYRRRGLATALLTAGTRLAGERGALLALTWTRQPALFARLGWSMCGQRNFSAAAPRALLAELRLRDEAAAGAAGSFFAPRPQPIAVRPLRRVDMPAVQEIYAANLPGRCGWPVRSDAYWEWLLNRGAFDRAYVAEATVEAGRESIVGYAFVRQSRIVEVLTRSGREDAARALLARVAADATEQDAWIVRLDAPPQDPLHAVFPAAGGETNERGDSRGEPFLARVFDPLALLNRLQDGLAARLLASGAGPCALGIEVVGGLEGAVRGASLQIRVVERSGRLAPRLGGGCRQRIALGYADLAPLLVGARGADELAASGRLSASSPAARRLAAALFPGRRWWRPPLDDLLA